MPISSKACDQVSLGSIRIKRAGKGKMCKVDYWKAVDPELVNQYF